MTWQIGDCRLDDRTRELRRDGSLVAIEGRVFDLLAELATQSDRVVTKDELIESVWRGRIVSETAISSCIKSARAAIGDNGKEQRFLKTIHGKGYRLIAAEALESETSSPAASAVSANEVTDTDIDRLPADRFALFGRANDIDGVTQLLAENRLVSLLGIGGTGKTRLAVAAGRSLLTTYPDGVWFVDLVPVSNSNGIDLAVAEAIGLTLTSGAQRGELAQLIKNRRLLLILDNCEHISELVAEACDELLDKTHTPQFLVTSRKPLDLADEFRMNVEPLTVEAIDGISPAVELFRATAARLGVLIKDSELGKSQAICMNLDGLPLAIELAASQLRQLSLGELSDRLDRRFELLSGHAHSGQQRRSSLHGVLVDTWEMLDADEKTLLGQLSIFPQLFSIADIEELRAVDSQTIVSHVFGGLVDKSLVKRQGAQWRLLETVRLFARQQLTDDERLSFADKHANWCLQRVGDSVQRHCYCSALADWCYGHFNDLRVAENHLLASGRTTEAAHLIAALAFTMHRDGGTRAAVILRHIENDLAHLDEPALVARLHFCGVMCAMAVRSPKQMAVHGDDALRAADASGDASLRAIALILASWSTALENIDRALIQVRQAASLALEHGDYLTRDFAESYNAWHLAGKRNYDEAIDVARNIIARYAEAPENEDYPVKSAACAVAAIVAISNPKEANQVLNRFGEAESDLSMWSMRLLSACTLASTGQYVPAARICTTVNAQQVRAGVSPLPDLLVPAAFMAYELGEHQLAASWLRAVRDAGIPTQSFIMAVAYRRLSGLVDLSDDDATSVGQLEQIGAQALQWIQKAE